MNRALSATFLLGLLAAASAGIAAWYYPWPVEIQQSGKVGEWLFKEFPASQVRTIEVSRFNNDRQALERVLLQRKGERWVIPATADFNANNALQVARAIKSVQDRKVLQKISDNEQDHLKNGVIDPDKFQNSELRSGLGRKITIKDRNGQILADLIVGFPLENSEQQSLFCVRVPGEPQVYSVQFDLEALSTRFQDWVDPNLLGFSSPQNPQGQVPTAVELDAYRIDMAKLNEPAAKTKLYRAEIFEVEGGLGLRNLEIPSGDQWQPADATDDLKRMLIKSTISQLGAWTFSEVRLKAKQLSEFFKNPGPVADPALFNSMNEFGFRQTAGAGSPAQFEGAGGQVSVNLRSGLRINAYIGKISGSIQSGTKLSRFLFLTAQVNPDALPQPQAPVSADGGQPTDEQQRNYQRELDDWKSKTKKAEELAAEYNRQYAPWYFALSDDAYLKLLPELTGLTAKAPTENKPEKASETPATETPATPPSGGEKPAEGSGGN
jgi:hypothetical protein